MDMNNPNYDISFIELRCKEVINASDGRKLGRITDLIFSNETGKIRGIVTPYVKRTFFGKGQEVFIPWRCVKKLGEDVIIVDISGVNERGRESAPPPDDLPPVPQQIKNVPGMPDCDRKCEKCMLFDCEYRWKK